MAISGGANLCVGRADAAGPKAGASHARGVGSINSRVGVLKRVWAAHGGRPPGGTCAKGGRLVARMVAAPPNPRPRPSPPPPPPPPSRRLRSSGRRRDAGMRPSTHAGDSCDAAVPPCLQWTCFQTSWRMDGPLATWRQIYHMPTDVGAAARMKGGDGGGRESREGATVNWGGRMAEGREEKEVTCGVKGMHALPAQPAVGGTDA
eukprot:365916-Chlamydomonas_euryale.AAC.7